MRQLVLSFGSEWEPASLDVPLQPEVREQLVVLMAQAIVSLVDDSEEQGGRSGEARAIEQQDQAAASQSEGGDLHASVHGQASP